MCLRASFTVSCLGFWDFLCCVFHDVSWNWGGEVRLSGHISSKSLVFWGFRGLPYWNSKFPKFSIVWLWYLRRSTRNWISPAQIPKMAAIDSLGWRLSSSFLSLLSYLWTPLVSWVTDVLMTSVIRSTVIGRCPCCAAWRQDARCQLVARRTLHKLCRGSDGINPDLWSLIGRYSRLLWRRCIFLSLHCLHCITQWPSLMPCCWCPVRYPDVEPPEGCLATGLPPHCLAILCLNGLQKILFTFHNCVLILCSFWKRCFHFCRTWRLLLEW